MLFLIENAPLEDWQRDILSMIREEAYYFAPQAQTKIMNEGWATYWHAKIMTERALTDAEVIDFADHHSGTVAMHPGQINPYKLGFELWKDIEDRWNKGKFGKEYDECDDWQTKRELGSSTRPRPRKDLRDAARPQRHHIHRRLLHRRVLSRAQVLHLCLQPRTRRLRSRGSKLEEREAETAGRADQLRPAVHLRRRWQLRKPRRTPAGAPARGLDLRLDYARDTLEHIFKLWSRPVHIKTVVEGKDKLLGYDGENHLERTVADA